MRSETRSHRNRVTDPGPNWIRSGEDLLKTDPVERVVVMDLEPTNIAETPAAVAAQASFRPADPARAAVAAAARAATRTPGSHPPRAALPAELPASRRSTPVPTRPPGNRLKLAPSLPAIVAPDSLPPIYDEEEAPSCRAPAVDTSYAGGSAGIRPAGRSWVDGVMRQRYVPTGELMAAPPAAPEPTPTPLDPEDDDDEQSTGLFEPGEDPYAQYAKQHAPPAPRGAVAAPSGSAARRAEEEETLVPQRLVPSASAGIAIDPEPSRPSLALVRSVSESVEEEFVGMRAAPLASEPRPATDEIVDWPPPMVRPGIDYPDDWSAADMGNTLIVIDPIQYRARRSRLGVVLLDIAAWILGFVAMFLTGLVTTGSAALVFFALSL